MFMLTPLEKEMAIEEVKRLSAQIAATTQISNKIPKDEQFRLTAFFKAMNNFMELTTPALAQFKNISLNQTNLITPKQLEENLSHMLTHMVTVGSKVIPTKKYTTGDLSKFMGVSVATINNWMDKDRIQGFEKKGRNKQARIPEHATYLSHSGERLTIREIVQLYEVEQEKSSIQDTVPLQKQKELVDAIDFFEKKYEGSFHDTLGSRAPNNAQEERDAIQWETLIRRANNTE
jgi:hypothetical protein